MQYTVRGVMQFNVKMLIDADSKEEAEQEAMDRMDEGSIDGFTLGEAVGDNEIFSTREGDA